MNVHLHPYEPVFGIIKKTHETSLFGPETPLIKALAIHAHRRGSRLLIVHPDEMRSLADGAQRVYARWYDADRGVWMKGYHAPPEVILRKFGNFGAHGKDARLALDRRLTFLNPYGVRELVADKLAFADIMHRHGVPHPQTALFDPHVFTDMLNRNPSLFVKDRKGSRGEYVIRVEKHPGDVVRLRYTLGTNKKYLDTTTERAAKSIQKVMGWMQEDTEHPLEFVVQNDVSGSQHEGKKFSLRIVLHKGPDGNPRIVGGLVRLGKEGAFLENVSQGGQQLDEDHESFLKKVFPRTHPEVIERINRVCRHAFSAVESEVKSRSGLPLGELGLDILLDGKNPVVLEANSRCTVDDYDPYFPTFKESIFQAGARCLQEAGLIRRLHPVS